MCYILQAADSEEIAANMQIFPKVLDFAPIALVQNLWPVTLPKLWVTSVARGALLSAESFIQLIFPPP